jgi:phosphoribosylformylglycinamidine cyclo-ligase
VKPKALVLSGDGINCENETVHALNLAGFEASIGHLGSIIRSSNPHQLLQDYQALVLPGGFSFGDEVRSGKILALKLEAIFKESLEEFVKAGKPVIGICNGFQALIQLGLLPYSESKSGKKRVATLTHNNHGRFMDRWVNLTVSPDNHSPFLDGLKHFPLPVRHGEGRLVLADSTDQSLEAQIIKLGPLTYEEDINGSFNKIAALTNNTGNVFGLMPHPECFVRWTQNPAWTRQKDKLTDTQAIPAGLKFFQNAAKLAAQFLPGGNTTASTGKADTVTSYREAGVDVQAADDFVGEIKRINKERLEKKAAYLNAKPENLLKAAGGYASVYKLSKEQAVALTTDGVGTKLMLCAEQKNFKTIGIDLVAMCANDLICVGATPALFLDYYAMGRLNTQRGKDIIEGLSEGLAQAGMLLVGGETAEMPDLYQPEDFDLAGFACGFVNPQDLITADKLTAGNILVALASDGIHSNGLSLARKLITADSPLRSELLVPTKIYVSIIQKILKEHKSEVTAITHITGGGFSNLLRFKSDLGFIIDNAMEPQPIFQEMTKQVALPEMYQTFNMGMGMVLAVKDQKAAQVIIKLCENAKQKAQIIGKVTTESGKVKFDLNSLASTAMLKANADAPRQFTLSHAKQH